MLTSRISVVGTVLEKKSSNIVLINKLSNKKINVSSDLLIDSDYISNVKVGDLFTSQLKEDSLFTLLINNNVSLGTSGGGGGGK